MPWLTLEAAEGLHEAEDADPELWLTLHRDLRHELQEG
jgi:hypothetical protein